MEFTLTKEQKLYKLEIENFIKANLCGEEAESFSMEQWKMISEFGLLGIAASKEYGGSGESYLTAAVVMESLGYSCYNNGFIFVIANHIWVAQNIIELYGSDILKRKYLSSMISGEKIGAFALTEIEAGSDALAINTYAEKIGDGYMLNGSKMFISNGPIDRKSVV